MKWDILVFACLVTFGIGYWAGNTKPPKIITEKVYDFTQNKTVMDAYLSVHGQKIVDKNNNERLRGYEEGYEAGYSLCRGSTIWK